MRRASGSRQPTLYDNGRHVAALKRIYLSATADEAILELDAFEAKWGTKYKSVVRLWRGNSDNIIQFMPEIRKVIYTMNAIESLNMSMRKLTCH